jgi:hypothetical protein
LPVLQVAAVSGYEVPIVAMAVIALVLIVGSSIAGILTRLRRGRVPSSGDQRPGRHGRSPLP